MKIKETTLAMGRTINLGNFESLRLDLSLTLDVGEYLESVDYDEVVQDLEDTLSRNLEAIAARQTGQAEEVVEEFI
tara:strand:- start:5033 stop:5260 length:228 start_codon:yes stop_codon:yes gene_type:complete